MALRCSVVAAAAVLASGQYVDGTLDEAVSLLQVSAARNVVPHGKGKHKAISNVSSYLKSSLVSLRSAGTDLSDMPDNDEPLTEFAEQRSKGSNIVGDWTMSSIKYNNLGGQGPDAGQEGIRYAAVTSMNDRDVDLIVNAVTPYERFVKSSNGLHGRIGTINLYHERDVDLKFSFVDSENDDPVVMGAFTFTVFDLDEGPGGTAKETFTVGGFVGDYMMDFTSIQTTDLPDGRRQYASTTHGRGNNNPTDPFDLSEVAAAHSVSLDFPEGMSEIMVNYAVTKAAEHELRPDYMGRNFQFAGVSSMYYCKQQPLLIDYGLARTVYSNLGGEGPDSSSPEGVRFTNIATINGKPIDLLINAVGEYKPHKNTANGVTGKYGVINMKNSASATFDISFIGTEDDAPETIEAVYFSVLDLDEGKRGKLKEGLIMHEYAASWLTEDTEVKVSTESNGLVRFDSSSPGNGRDNPLDPMLLNERQKNRGATFLLDNVSTFRMTLNVGGGPNSGRNFMFTGKSSVVFC